MKKWQKKIVALGVVVTIVLLIRRASKEDLEFGELKVKNITKQLTRHKVDQYKTRDLGRIKMIVVHHSATDSGTPQAYANYHVNTRDWPGIGYHYVIQKDGTIFQTNELDTISYHTGGQNTHSIGVCLTGNYDKQKPPAIQIQKCGELIAAIRQQFSQDLRIKGHRDFSNKSCPGDNVSISEIASLAEAYEQAIQA